MCSLHVPTLHCSTCHGQCTCPCPRVNVCPAQLHVPPDQERRCHSQQFYQNLTNIELRLPDFFCKIDISEFLFSVAKATLHSQMSVCQSIYKTPQQLEIIIILHSSFLHFATFKLFSLFNVNFTLIMQFSSL